MIGTVELRDRWSHKGFVDRVIRNASTNTSTVVVVCVTAAASLSPAMLPRSAWLQGIFTGVLLLLGLATARGAMALVRCAVVVTFDRKRSSTRMPILRRSTDIRVGMCCLAVVLLMAAVIAAHRWQNSLRDATGSARIGPGYWNTVAVVAAAVVLGVVAGSRWLRRPRSWTRSLAAPAGGMVALVVAGTTLIPSSTASAVQVPVSAMYAPTDRVAASAVSIDDLRAHGRTFVTGGPSEQIRVYVSPETAADPARRAALAIAELDRTRAWERPVILVAVPTGSGWVDTRALAGFTERFGRGTAVVAAAYSSLPSWLASVVSRRDAIATTTALLRGIEQRIETLPTDRRPAVILYGQSLGAVAGAEAVRRLQGAGIDSRLCAQFLVGPPMGTPIAATANVLANSSDPVVIWSPRLLLSPPAPPAGHDDAPRPGWLPILSFLQTSIDLLSALAPGPGHGHQYGTDQVDGPLDCTPEPAAGPAASAAPLATSNAAATR